VGRPDQERHAQGIYSPSLLPILPPSLSPPLGYSPFRSERIYEWAGLTKKDKHKAIDMAVIGMDPEFDRR